MEEKEPLNTEKNAGSKDGESGTEHQTAENPPEDNAPEHKPAAEPKPAPPRMIEIHTRYDIEMMRAFYKFSTVKTIIIFGLAFSFLFIVMGLAELLPLEDAKYFFVFLYFGLAVLTPLLIFFMIHNGQKKTWSMSKIISPETHVTFKFGIDAVFLDSNKGVEYISKDIYAYSLLYQIVETDTHFFMYISPAQAFVIPKKDFTVGTPEDLSAFLSAKLGMAFKPRRKK